MIIIYDAKVDSLCKKDSRELSAKTARCSQSTLYTFNRVCCICDHLEYQRKTSDEN